MKVKNYTSQLHFPDDPAREKSAVIKNNLIDDIVDVVSLFLWIIFIKKEDGISADSKEHIARIIFEPCLDMNQF